MSGRPVAASLAQAGDSPRVCLVGTALGDAGDTLLAMYAAFGRAGWRVSHLALFPEPNVADIQEHLLLTASRRRQPQNPSLPAPVPSRLSWPWASSVPGSRS